MSQTQTELVKSPFEREMARAHDEDHNFSLAIEDSEATSRASNQRRRTCQNMSTSAAMVANKRRNLSLNVAVRDTDSKKEQKIDNALSIYFKKNQKVQLSNAAVKRKTKNGIDMQHYLNIQ